ncbi:hypothetical protein ACFFV7_49140 [Nonomuraea spiralis]|uniref:Secreted protein n=1 Tax=Nonomuraea spiralis TaxID=46182 RepID=A0ABV5IYX9_9ACTN|nr:hypothetical protein [Nonomuraea spiralis]GGT33772.1 hypothetical protein GCM10010176_092930 [Nonomuraea spiralis]
MRSRPSSAAALLIVGMAVTLTAAALPAQAATGQVVVFSTEFQPLDVYDNPTRCTKLPLAAHTLNNQTDGDVTLYGDPMCMRAVVTVRPGHGSHVPPMSGSFRA